MPDSSYLKFHINAHQTFVLNEKLMSTYSGRLKKIIKQENRTQITNSGIDIDDFPGGADGFELISRFCYNNGRFTITVSNVSLLHCCAVFLGMTEKVAAGNLLRRTEIFLEGMFYWSWNDLLICLKSCEGFLSYADSCGLVKKLICSLLAKISQSSDTNLSASSSSSSSSPETASGFRLSSSAKTTPELIKPCSSSKAWWFDDLCILSPLIIELLIKTLGAYGAENNSLLLTRFLLHYLKTSAHSKSDTQGSVNFRSQYRGLADTAVYGVVLMGGGVFSCRGLFRVLRLVSGFGISRECKVGLERLIGASLNQANLDDMLVSGHDGNVYDVNLVLRLIRVFVDDDGVSIQNMKKVGRLIDKYLREIAPDQNLKMLKFLAIAESLPSSARDCFDGVYRAIDIYLESHPTLSFEERSRLCGCLSYEKLTLEACKDLAKNPRTPPRVAIQALMSQQPNCMPQRELAKEMSPSKSNTHVVFYDRLDGDSLSEEICSEDVRVNLQRMQWRVVQLEKVCKEMKGQMRSLVRSKAPHSRQLPRLC